MNGARPGYKMVKRRVWKNPPLWYQIEHLKTIEEVESAFARIESSPNTGRKTIKRARRAAQKRIAELKLRAF